MRNRHGVPVYEYPGNGTLLGRRTDWAGRVVYLEHGQVFPGSSVDGEPFADAATLAFYTDPLVGLSAGRTLSAGQVYHYYYDNKGRLTETTSRDRYLSGTDWQFRERRGYSRTGLVVADTFTVAEGPEVIRRYQYNRRGQRTVAADTVTAAVGTVSGDHIGRTAYLYNPSTGRLDSLLSTVVTESGAVSTTAALGFDYDRGGRPTERRLWLGGSTTPIVTTWAYDHVGRDSVLATVRGDSVHYRFTTDATSYTAIDELLHYTAQRTPVGETWNYTAEYAANGTRRLLQTLTANVTPGGSGGSRTHQWSYDVFGNRVTEGYSSSIGEGSACEGTAPLSYGADNRLLVKHSYPGCTRYSRYWVNQAGHRLGSTDSLQTGAAGLQSKMSYTTAGQLYYAMTPTSVAGAYDHVWHWYDAEGRRVLSKVHQANTIASPDPLTAGGSWTYYIYDGSDVALTLVGGPPGGVGTAWRVQGRYVSVGVDQPIAGRFWVDGAGDPVQPLALIADRQGSTIRALRPDGSRETRTMYFQRDAFGALEDAMGQAGGELNPGTGFTGASTPTQTGGFTYLRNRWYDPATGRFLTQDPIGLAGGVNLYAYAGNNPVAFRDPFGLCPEPPCRSEDDPMRDRALPDGVNENDVTWDPNLGQYGGYWHDLDGRIMIPEPENESHYDQWRIIKPGVRSPSFFPADSRKPRPGQKRLKPNQSWEDPWDRSAESSSLWEHFKSWLNAPLVQPVTDANPFVTPVWGLPPGVGLAPASRLLPNPIVRLPVPVY